MKVCCAQPTVYSHKNARTSLGNVMHYTCSPSKTKCRYVAGFGSVYGCGDGLLSCVLAEAVYKYFRHSTFTRPCSYQGPEWQSTTTASLVASWATLPWAVREKNAQRMEPWINTGEKLQEKQFCNEINNLTLVVPWTLREGLVHFVMSLCLSGWGDGASQTKMATCSPSVSLQETILKSSCVQDLSLFFTVF